MSRETVIGKRRQTAQQGAEMSRVFRMGGEHIRRGNIGRGNVH